jgi:LPS O-antigen subunit length determinant protein (WzzB/FepE family)
MNNPNKQEMSSNIPPQYGFPGMYQQEDELDLFAAFLALVGQWRWLAGITFIGTLIAVVIALSLPRNYEVEARLAHPTQADVQTINVKGYAQLPAQSFEDDTNDERGGFSQQELFNRYYARLKSANHFKDFIIKNDWLSKLDPDASVAEDQRVAGVYEDFSTEVLRPKKPKAAPEDLPPVLLGVKFLSKDEELGVKLVNDYINHTNQDLLKSLADEGKALRDMEKESIELKIAALRKKAAMERATKLVELTAAYDIAAAMDINKPTTLTSLSQTQEDRSRLMVSVGAQDQNVLALMGTEYLQNEMKGLRDRASIDSFIEQIPELKKQLADQKSEAEIEAFKSLVANDPYIKELPDLMGRLSELNQLTFDFNNAQSFRFDKSAMMTGKVKKSNKIMIVAGGFILSSIMAVLYVLLMNAYRKHLVES